MSTFRSDRLLTLYLFEPAASLLRRPVEKQVSILMYHSISEGRTEGVHPYYEVCTSPRVFAKQLGLLQDKGYEVIGLDEAVGAIFRRPNLPSMRENGPASGAPRPFRAGARQKEVVLTFDDGFRDFEAEALPILKRYGFPATVFLPTAFIGDSRKSLLGRECLTWDEVRRLQRSSVAFASHSASHVRLEQLTERMLHLELETSKKRIEDETGVSCEGFSCPFAFPETDESFVERLRSALFDAGYKYGVTTMIGEATGRSDPFFLERIPVNEFDDSRFFEAKLKGGYRWLHSFQRFSKLAKRAVARR